MKAGDAHGDDEGRMGLRRDAVGSECSRPPCIYVGMDMSGILSFFLHFSDGLMRKCQTVIHLHVG